LHKHYPSFLFGHYLRSTIAALNYFSNTTPYVDKADQFWVVSGAATNLLHPEKEPLVAALEHQLIHALGRLLDLLKLRLFRENDQVRVLRQCMQGPTA
jgi:hypothetical protein